MGKNTRALSTFMQVGFVLLALVPGCFSPAEIYDIHIHTNEARADSGVCREVVDNLNRLTSANFFEYTQAARHLIEMGPSVIPELLGNAHLRRESNDTIVPVCRLLIEIIFAQQDRDWVVLKLQHPVPEICEIAREDLARRDREEKEDEEQDKDNEGE